MHFYLDHDWLEELGEQLPVYRPPLDMARLFGEPALGTEGIGLTVRYLTPHSKWSIHSEYQDNLFMLSLSRGGPTMWMSPSDAAKITVRDNDWVEAVNRNGVVVLGEVFWDVVPYVTLAIVVVGTWWRYRYDKFGWTTRSSQLYESRLLRIASPMFHFGIMVVIVGHVIGLLIPESWTDAAGLSHEAYHVQAVALGSVAGVMTLAGIILLIYRRRTNGPVFSATTVNDKLMYLVLVAAIVAGLYATALGSGVFGEAYNYRESVSLWFRSIWVLQPRGDLMAEAPLYYQLHVTIGLMLFALWPFTRLVHAFSAPVAYLFRPYIVYRSRDIAAPGQLVGSRPHRRGW